MKFALGTAQFSNEYGLLKKKANVKKIFEFVNKESIIESIDTSPFYGKAEKLIGKYLKRDIKITTKINPFKFISTKKNLDIFKKDLDISLRNLKLETIDGILFHKESDIKKIKKDTFFYYLDELIKNKIIKKVGFSTYNTNNFKKNLNIYNFKLIQLPLNIFNSNVNYIHTISLMKKKFKLEFHARSIFLQGLGLFEKVNNYKFRKLNDKLKIMNKISKKYSISNYDIMLSGVSRFDFIDSFIIGCSSFNDLIAIKNFKQKKLKNKYFKSLIIRDSFINDPRKWPKKI